MKRNEMKINSLLGEGDAEYEIHPVCTTKGLRPSPSYTYLKNYGQNLETFYGAYLIKNDENAFLVDTGITAEQYLEIFPERPCGIEPPITESLSHYGVAPDDIEAVILTHLHFDHAAQFGIFPESRKIVQRTELDNAYRDEDYLSFFYCKDYLEGVEFETVSGDANIADGICVLHVPGHTPGTQAICVRTGDGISAISGFCVVSENFSTGELVVPAIHYNVEDAWDSMKKLVEIADYVYPNHSGKRVDVRSFRHNGTL